VSRQPKGLDGLDAISERLGGLFRQLGDVVETAKSRLAEQAEGVRDVDTPAGPAKLDVSFGVRTGGLRSAPPRSGATGPARDFEVRKRRPAAEPEARAGGVVLDCLDEGASYLVVAEAPGLAASDVVVEAPDAGRIVVTLKGAPPRRAEQAFAEAIDPGGVGVSLRNGILEISVAKAAAKNGPQA
jgi:HSP20 family molecular chaperone IbpA